MRRLAALLLPVAALGALACSSGELRGSAKVAPQEWQKTRGPVVPHDSFPRDCSLCHEGGTWQRIRSDFQFDHERETGVPLLGAHAEAECLRCHNDRGPVASFAARGCAGCHEDVHRGQQGVRCEDCHEAGRSDWQPREAIALHHKTRFPLVGAHATAACFACHEGAQAGNFARTDIACLTCHQDDLAQASSPDHLAQGWVDDCQRCHIPTSWTGAGFNHAGFPLSGAHAALACAACHAGDVYAGTPNTCVACHQADYDGASEPDHVAAGFSTDCRVCHGTTSWEQAHWPHPGFALDGAHAAQACSACHAGGVFPGTPSACVACHLDDYRATTSPNHATSGFPTSCESCHGTSSWEGAVFDHPFPIASGAHAPLDCADCHTNPGDFAVFSCVTCHDHNQRDTDADHDEVQGYVYLSSACYACHQDGQEDAHPDRGRKPTRRRPQRLAPQGPVPGRWR